MQLWCSYGDLSLGDIINKIRQQVWRGMLHNRWWWWRLSYHYLSVVSITTLDYTYIIYNINLLDSRDHLNIIIFLLSRPDADSCWLIYLLPSNIKPATFASYACLLLLARTPNYFSKVRDHS